MRNDSNFFRYFMGINFMKFFKKSAFQKSTRQIYLVHNRSSMFVFPRWLVSKIIILTILKIFSELYLTYKSDNKKISLGFFLPCMKVIDNDIYHEFLFRNRTAGNFGLLYLLKVKSTVKFASTLNIPLRFRKAGRVLWRGARETY